MKINFCVLDGMVRTRVPYLVEREKYDEIIILPEEISRNTKYIEIDPEIFVAEVGGEGYMLSSNSFVSNTALLYFNEKEDFVFSSPSNIMPIMGIRRNANAWFAIA